MKEKKHSVFIKNDRQDWGTGDLSSKILYNNKNVEIMHI